MTARITSQIWITVKANQRLLMNLSWTAILFLVRPIMNQEGKPSRTSTKITSARALRQAESEVFQRGKPNISRKSGKQSKNLLAIKNPICMPQSSVTNIHQISTRVWQTYMPRWIRVRIRIISIISLACKLKLTRTCWITKRAFREMLLRGQDTYLKQIHSKYWLIKNLKSKSMPRNCSNRCKRTSKESLKWSRKDSCRRPKRKAWLTFPVPWQKRVHILLENKYLVVK